MQLYKINHRTLYKKEKNYNIVQHACTVYGTSCILNKNKGTYVSSFSSTLHLTSYVTDKGQLTDVRK